MLYFVFRQAQLIILRKRPTVKLSLAIDSNNVSAKIFFSALAQLVEQMTVNHWVLIDSNDLNAKMRTFIPLFRLSSVGRANDC